MRKRLAHRQEVQLMALQKMLKPLQVELVELQLQLQAVHPRRAKQPW